MELFRINPPVGLFKRTTPYKPTICLVKRNFQLIVATVLVIKLVNCRLGGSITQHLRCLFANLSSLGFLRLTVACIYGAVPY
jgi:hypothetical protein